MKRLLCCATLFAAASFPVFGQMSQMPKTAASQPASPAEHVAGKIGGVSVAIDYSAPSVKGRAGHIFTTDGLISTNPHYPVWRAGANAATTITLDGDLKIGNVLLHKGMYTLFINIASSDHWVLIVSKQTGEWGLSYDASQDLGQTPMTMTVPPSTIEQLKWSVTDNGNGTGALTLAWENKIVSVDVSAAQ